MRTARKGVAGVVLLAALVGCDVPIGTPQRDGEGGPVAAKTDARTVQVIVRLRFEPPAGAAPDSDAYKAALLAARSTFFGEIDAIPHRVVRTYDTLPLVVLSVAPGERAALAKVPSVASIEDDRLNAPLAQ